MPGSEKERSRTLEEGEEQRSPSYQTEYALRDTNYCKVFSNLLISSLIISEMFSPGVLLGLLTAVNLILGQSDWYPGTPKTGSCERNCSLPACFCGRGIPGGLSQHQTPQFVLLSFDDAVNDLNRDFYNRLFAGRVNPNGCPIAATFFVSHEWTDYSQVHQLYTAGHEISSHSVTHSHPSGRGESSWALEIGGQAELLSRHALVEPSHITGVRAPFLETGGDPMFRAISRLGFQYDSSLPSRYQSPALWPYTAHQGARQACSIPPCPSLSHPEVWELPMTMMTDGLGGQCAMLDACRYEETEDSIQRMLTRNFVRNGSVALQLLL